MTGRDAPPCVCTETHGRASAIETHRRASLHFKPGTMIYPLPAVMVSCGETPDEYNIITIAWTGTICSDPPMCYISVRPGRTSYPIIKRTGEFVINLTTEALARATDWCGCRSGKKYNKWKEMNLTPHPSTVVKAPGIAESPVNIECVVKQILPLGTHDMFIAEVVNITVDEQYIDEKGAFSLAKALPLVYNHGHYFGLGKPIGKFGWSVEKKKKKK
jgi:flavin reductase (DIM6/NTAB) family NADH-FMN oxidoreductase RutF